MYEILKICKFTSAVAVPRRKADQAGFAAAGTGGCCCCSAAALNSLCCYCTVLKCSAAWNTDSGAAKQSSRQAKQAEIGEESSCRNPFYCNTLEHASPLSTLTSTFYLSVDMICLTFTLAIEIIEAGHQAWRELLMWKICENSISKEPHLYRSKLHSRKGSPRYTKHD